MLRDGVEHDVHAPDGARFRLPLLKRYSWEEGCGSYDLVSCVSHKHLDINGLVLVVIIIGARASVE